MTRAYNLNEIVKYGRDNGYSPKEINNVINANKNRIIEYGINSGYKGSEINNVLNAKGYTNYNPLLVKTNWEQMLPNLAKGAKEFARDMSTMGGAMIKPFIDVTKTPEGQRMEAAKKRFSEAINNDALRRTAMGAGIGAGVGSVVGPIGTLGGAFTGGLVGLLGAKGLANAYLQPYETSTKDIGQAIQGNKSWSDLATDILQGGMRNPFYSGVDLLSAGGAKALGGIGRAAGRAIPADAPMWIQEVIQSPGLRDFSRAGTNAIQSVKAKNVELIQPLEKLKATLGVDDEQLARFIIANETNLTGKELELAKEIKKSLRTGEERAIEYGLLNKEDSKTNVVAQYGMNKLRDVIPDIIHDDVVNYIKDKKLSPRMEEVISKNPDIQLYLDDILKQGDKLYDEYNIAPLTQALVTTTDPRGEVVANAFAKTGPGYFNTKRIIGRATPKDYAINNKLTDSIEFQQNQIGRVTGAIDAMETLLLQPGMKKIIDASTEVPKGNTVINPRLFRENIAREFQSGRDVDINKVLKESNLAEKGAYLIPNVYFRALENMFGRKGKSTGMLASFKKTVLANPHWFGLNRIGNWTNNSMGGVKFIEDYGDARRYESIMPKQLANQTSFNSYVGSDQILGLSDSFTRPAKDLITGFKKFADSEKGLKDIKDITGNFIANTNNIVANPIYKLEAAAERMDRYANFIRQAKRYAKDNKIKDWKEVVKKSDKDAELFNKLNTQVNKDLGDYIGRNYLIPNEYYEAISNIIPFYRFLSQTGRTTFHQLANHPLAFQTTVMSPARAGKQISEDVIRQFGLSPDDYEGGVPYAQQIDGNWRYLRTEPLPAGAVAHDLLSLSSLGGMVSPIYKLGEDVIMYKKDGERLPKSPGSELQRYWTGSTKGYEPTLGERVGYAASQFANTFYAPVRTPMGWGREAVNTIMGKPSLSLYDTVLKENPYTIYPKQLPVETIGKWVGIQNRPYYPAKIERPKKPNKWQRRQAGIVQQAYKTNTER